MLLECSDIISDGVKDTSSVLSAYNYVGLHSRWANRFAQKCSTFPNGACLEFSIPEGKKK